MTRSGGIAWCCSVLRPRCDLRRRGRIREVQMATDSARRVGTRTRRAVVRGGDPILAAKLAPPSMPDCAVQRPRITTLVAEGVRSCPLTVVTGPVGAGKTMALTMWAAAEPGPVAWVSLDG